MARFSKTQFMQYSFKYNKIISNYLPLFGGIQSFPLKGPVQIDLNNKNDWNSTTISILANLFPIHIHIFPYYIALTIHRFVRFRIDLWSVAQRFSQHPRSLSLSPARHATPSAVRYTGYCCSLPIPYGAHRTNGAVTK